MKTFAQFSQAREVLFYYAHSIEFKSGGFALDNMHVTGYQTQSLRLRQTGDTVSNWPHYLVVRKILKSGKLSSKQYLQPINELDSTAREMFWSVFKQLPEYQFHLQIQQDMANDIFREYGWNIPENVATYFSHNKALWDRVMYAKISRDNKRLDAKTRILEVQEQFYRDENLSGVFDAYMSHQPVVEKGDKTQRILELRYEIRKLDEQLMQMSSIEAKWVEREERDRLMKELHSLI